MSAKKLTIGFIAYGKTCTEYLPYFLSSVFSQSYADHSLLCVIADEDGYRGNSDLLEQFPQIEILSEGKNYGFGKAFNLMISRAKSIGSEFFLAANPDLVIDSDAISRMMEKIENDNSLGSAAPKIYKWNYGNADKRTDKAKISDSEKSAYADSFGIVMKSGLRFFDLAQGQADLGQFDHSPILGPSGAAALYRISALEKAKENGHYFDERMFMYKEDCDLAYRLFLAGFRSSLVADARAYHDRTAGGIGDSKLKIALNRRSKSRQVKRWSLANQLLICKKFWRLQNFFNKLVIVWHIAIMFVFCLIFEQYLLKEFFKIFK